MEYCTIEKAASLLGVSRPTVYKLIKDGQLKRHEVVGSGTPALKINEVKRLAQKRSKR